MLECTLAKNQTKIKPKPKTNKQTKNPKPKQNKKKAKPKPNKPQVPKT